MNEATHNAAQDLYAFESDFAQTYSANCETCGRAIEVSTQRDQSPEYYTEVHVRCVCGGSAKFELPVN